MQKSIALLFGLLTTFNVLAEVTVKNVDFIANGNEGRFVIKYEGNLKENPVLSVKDKIVSLNIPNASVNPKIERKVSIVSQFDTKLFASQEAAGIANFKALIPFSLKGKEGQVNIMLKDTTIEIIVPKTWTTVAAMTPVARTVPKKEIAVDLAPVGEHLDESYLAKMEAEEKSKTAKVEAKEIEKKVAVETKATSFNEDGVTMTAAGTAKAPVAGTEGAASEDKEAKSQFSVLGYLGKFVAFLSIMLLGFYGVLQMFKKGIIKKGNLGFLNSTKLVEVLSTTHVAPKKSLLVVRAHKQVFLISNTDAGIQLVSEINDVAGLLKQGEKEIAGNNFDTEVTSANSYSKEFRLKEDVNPREVEVYSGLDDLLNEDEIVTVAPRKAPAKSIKNAYAQTNASVQNNEALNRLADSAEKEKGQEVRFSDQIKTKLRGLKQLQ